MLDIDDRFAANALHLAAADAIVLVFANAIQIGVNDLELQTRTSRIHNQNVHHSFP